MSIFGWDYPPGVSSVPGDEDYICEVCGGTDETCVCPECPVCGDIGNIDCYKKYEHMIITHKQIWALTENTKKYEEACRMEAEFEAQYVRDNKHNLSS